MNVNIIPTPNFKKEAKRLIKKFRSLKSEPTTYENITESTLKKLIQEIREEV